MSILGELQRQNAGAWVELFELDSTAQGGSVLYFHAGKNSLNTSVVWQGNTYEPFPIQATGFEVSGQQMPRPKLAVANVSGAITAVLNTVDLLGAKITRRRTMVKYLDDVNFPIVQKPTPAVLAFTRSSTATYYDSDGKLKTASANTPRIDYDPQSARTNLLVRSAEFDNAVWIKSLNGTASAPIVNDNAAIAPDGISTAESVQLQLNGATDGSWSWIYQNRNCYLGESLTFSIFVKAESSLDVGKVVIISGPLANTFATLSNDWQRISISGIVTIAGTLSFGVRLRGNEGTSKSANVLIWGAQLEYGSTATDYIPTTTAQVTRMDTVRGLLIEEQRTNLLVRSAEFDNASWTTVNATVTANAIAAPDGTLSADGLIENTANGTHEIAQFTTIATGTAYTASIYIKSFGRTRLRIQLDAGRFPATALAFFDTSTGSPSNIGAGATATMTSVGNGWYRCTLTATSTSAGGAGAYFTLSSTGTTTFYTGDGASGLYLWGAQFEAGAFATSYIPTTTAAVTRAADVATVSGANFSSFYNASEGAIIAELYATPVNVATNTPTAFSITDGTSGNRIQARCEGTGALTTGLVLSGGVTQASIGAGFSPANNTAYKVGFAYKTNDFAGCGNGGTVNTDTAGTLPVVDRLAIGNFIGGQFTSNAFRRLRYYPRRLTNAELQSITGSGTVDDMPAFELDTSTGALSIYTLAQYNPTADANAHLADEIYYIAQKTQENHAIVEFELGSPIDLQGVTIPRRQIVANLCLWQYRGDGCGYAGGAVADELDVPTTVLANDKCSKRLSGCKLRFGETAELPYGGFPSAGLTKF